MTQAIATIYTISHRHREKIFATLIASIVLVGFAYVFLLQQAVVNVIERGKISQQVTSASVAVNDLEGKYFSLTNGVTLDLAKAKGLKQADVTAYIPRRPLTAMAPHNEL